MDEVSPPVPATALELSLLLNVARTPMPAACCLGSRACWVPVAPMGSIGATAEPASASCGEAASLILPASAAITW